MRAGGNAPLIGEIIAKKINGIIGTGNSIPIEPVGSLIILFYSSPRLRNQIFRLSGVRYIQRCDYKRSVVRKI